MGMFDTVKFGRKLVEKFNLSELKERDWQTKDLECALDTYEISGEGELLLKNRNRGLGVIEEGFAMRLLYTGRLYLLGEHRGSFTTLIATFENGWIKQLEQPAEDWEETV